MDFDHDYKEVLQQNLKLKEELKRLEGNKSFVFSKQKNPFWLLQKKKLEFIRHGHVKFVHISMNHILKQIKMYVKCVKDPVHEKNVRKRKCHTFILNFIYFRYIN